MHKNFVDGFEKQAGGLERIVKKTKRAVENFLTQGELSEKYRGIKKVRDIEAKASLLSKIPNEEPKSLFQSIANNVTGGSSKINSDKAKMYHNWARDIASGKSKY